MVPIEPKYEFNLHLFKAARIARNISVPAAAEALGIKKHAYYKKERGLIGITVNELCILLTLFGMETHEVGDFFTITNEKEC